MGHCVGVHPGAATEAGTDATAPTAAKAARAGKQRPAKLEDVVHQYDQLMQVGDAAEYYSSASTPG